MCNLSVPNENESMKLIRATGLLLLFFLPQMLLAGNENQPAGARRVGLGSAYTAVQGDFWQLFMNPAGMAGLTAPQAGAYFERRFLLNEINYGTAGFAMPFQERHVAGIEFGGFGFASYSESRIGLAYATTILDRFSLGAKFNYTRTAIANYGSASALYIDLGLLAKVTNDLSLGFRVFNANQANLDREIGEQIPTTLDLGLAYHASDRVLILFDMQKQVNYPVSFRGGLEYGVLDFLRIRAGASTAPVTLSAGLGLDYKGFEFDFANTLHEYLGYTPSVSLSYRFNSTAK